MSRILHLHESSPELARALRSGVVETAPGELRRARPVAVDHDTVALELIEPAAVANAASTRPASTALTWVRAVRPPSLTATLTPALTVLLYGRFVGWQADGLVALTSILGVLSLQIAVNLLNDYEDHLRLIDLPGSLGGAGLIQSGELSPRSVRRSALVFAAIGLVLGVPAFVASPAALGLIGALAIVAGLGYSSGPGLKYRALGDLAVVVLCGPALTIGMALGTFGRFDTFVVFAGLALGLAAVGLLHVNNFQDMTLDAARRARTLAHLLGPRGSRVYLVAVYALAFVAWTVAYVSAARTTHLLALPFIAVIPVAVLCGRLLAAQDPTALRMARVDAAKVHLAMGALAVLGLGLALSLPS
jgi:1,4-dihydroxy-2-naphthoate octaprenyltransferase